MIKEIIIGEQMDNLKKGFAATSSLFNRAKQFTGEKLGGAEKTVYDVNLEALIRRSDGTKHLTEKIVSNTTTVLQPNPNERFEDLVLTRIDKDRGHKVPKPNNLENLGHCFVDASNEIGYGYPYGAILAKVGEAETKIGEHEKDFVSKSSEVFIQPLKGFLEGQMRSIQKEKKTLELKRLDLDACKAKLKRLSENSPRDDAEEELRRAQTDFDRQCELTKLLMDELQVSYSHHLQCLTEFVDAQLNYYNNATLILKDLSKDIGGVGIQNSQSASHETNQANPSMFSAIFGTDAIDSGNKPALVDPKKAKVLFDYDAVDSTEISVWANQVINVQLIPNDNDWVLAEAGSDSGKIPKAYIQILDST